MLGQRLPALRRPALALGAAALAAIALAVAPASAETAPSPDAAPRASGNPLPSRANGVWAYDEAGPGMWSPTIKAYNDAATAPRHRLTQVFSYATDMEMYCPAGDPAQCRAKDLQVYYTPKGPGWQSTLRYHADLVLAPRIGSPHAPTVSIVPIIDGRTDENGYLVGFNELSARLARVYADKVATQICADPRIDGIQFDVEPFDVSTKNGQYWFYQQIAKNFAGANAGAGQPDPLGCVSKAHPDGRFFSVFTFAKALQPGTQSAANVTAIAHAHDNFYIVDSLYDLGPNPAGHLNDLPTYRTLVRQEVDSMMTWSAAADVPYGFGIPASASVHEYATCTGDCAPGADGSTGNPMIEYTKRAVRAIEELGAPADPRFLGTSIWDLGGQVRWNDTTVTPAPAPANVMRWLAANLPG